MSCHYDIVDWLQPDWMYEPGTDSFQWRELQRRPTIEIEVQRVDKEAWKLFERHHYLSSDLHGSAACFCAFVEDQPAAFTAVLPFPHPKRSGWREHRTVCLPDFQGVGIGNAMSEFVASLYRASGKPYFSTTSHPAMIRHRCKSKLWAMKRQPSRTARGGASSKNDLEKKHATGRLSASFEYIGPIRGQEAELFGLRNTLRFDPPPDAHTPCRTGTGQEGEAGIPAYRGRRRTLADRPQNPPPLTGVIG